MSVDCFDASEAIIFSDMFTKREGVGGIALLGVIARDCMQPSGVAVVYSRGGCCRFWLCSFYMKERGLKEIASGASSLMLI